MLHLVFPFLQISLLVSFKRFLLFKFFLHFYHLRVELPNDVVLLLLLKLLSLRLYILDRLSELKSQLVYHWRDSLLLAFLILSIAVGGIFVVFLDHPHSKLLLQFFDIEPVVLLSHDIPIFSSFDVILNFFVVIYNLLQLNLHLAVPLVPFIGLHIVTWI